MEMTLSIKDDLCIVLGPQYNICYEEAIEQQLQKTTVQMIIFETQDIQRRIVDSNGNMQDQKKSLRLPFTFTGKDIRADKVMLKCSIPFRFNSFADAEVAYMRDGDEGFALGHNIVTFSVRDIDVNPIKQNFFKSQADLDLLYFKDTQVGNNLSLYKLKMPNKLAAIGRPINQFQQFFLKKFDYVIENYDDYTENTT